MQSKGIGNSTITVCVDGNNVGYYGGKPFEVNQIALLLSKLKTHILDFSVKLFLPHGRKNSFNDDTIEANRVDLHLVSGTWLDRKKDDQYCLYHAIGMDGYYLSNDRKMINYVRDPSLKAIFEERRIGYSFRNGVAHLHLPPELKAKSLLRSVSERGIKEVIK